MTINGVKTDAEDWVGAFNCLQWDQDSTACVKLGKCVGSRQWNTANCGSGVCDLPAMGDGEDTSVDTKGYLLPGNYPVFKIYHHSTGAYYHTIPSGDVTLQQDVCRNGYPFCFEWKNFGFFFIEKLNGKEIFMDCNGKIGGTAIKDSCGVCGGKGPQYSCESTGVAYCTEYEYQQKCSNGTESGK